jgi:hypothetical protein
MSTIVTSNVSDGTLSIPTTYVTNGSAKAWVNFNGTGTIATRDSFNVASLTDNGTGDYTVNFSSAMNNTDFAVTTNSKQAVSTTVGASNAVLPSSAGILATTSVRVFSVSGTTPVDMALFFTKVHGDLA